MTAASQHGIAATPFGLPPALDSLYGCEFSRQPASPAEPTRPHKLYGVQSLADLFDEMRRRLGAPGATTPGAPPQP